MEGILDRPLLLAVITTDTQVLARKYSVYLDKISFFLPLVQEQEFSPYSTS